MPNTFICVRLANSRKDIDEVIKNHDHMDGERPEEYQIPDIHTLRDRFRPEDEDLGNDDLKSVKSSNKSEHSAKVLGDEAD